MSMQRGGMRGDDLGVMVPLGGSGGEKELIRLPKDIEAISPASSIFIHGRIQEELAGLYGLVATLAGDHKPTRAFLANMISARLGERGFARHEFLMGLSRMLVPSAMPQYRQMGGDGQGKRQGSGKQPKDGKHEDDE